MALSLLSSGVIIRPSLRHNSRRQAIQVRAHNHRDEDKGRSSYNIDDANLSVLRERIEQVKMKERLERCCRCENGWNYAAGYNYKLIRKAELPQFFELVGLVCGTVGFTFFSGTVFLCFVSLLIHLTR